MDYNFICVIFSPNTSFFAKYCRKSVWDGYIGERLQVKNSNGLKRELSLLDLTMASLSGIIGSGWLFGSLYSAQVAGPASIVSWIVGGIAVLFIGLVYAELGAMLPESGSIVRYPHYSHGQLTGFIMGWAAWISYASSPAVQAEGVMQYAAHWVPGLWNSHTNLLTGLGLLVSALLMVVFFIINYMGVRVLARVNTTVTFVKFIMPLATIIVFLFAGLHWGNVNNVHTGGFAPSGTPGIFVAIATSGIVFSYLGFRQAVDLAGEARNPQKDIPRALMFSIFVGIVLYVLLELVFVVGVPGTALVHGWSKLSYNAPFAQLAASLNLGWFAVLLYADAIISPAGTGNIYMASTTRVLYALGRNRYFPNILTKIDQRTGIPVVALVVALILGLVFLLPFPSWQSMVGLVSSATVFTYIIGPVTLTVFRRTAPVLHRPYRLGGSKIIAPLAFIVGSLIIYWTGWRTDSKLLLAFLIGIVVYFIFAVSMPKQIDRPSWQSIKAGIWIVVYLIVLLIMSYLGSNTLGELKNIIHYPWDVLIVICCSLVFYYWGVASGYKTPALEETLQEMK